MKKTHEFIVFRNNRTGTFLNKYKNKEGRLVYSAGWVKDIQDALLLEEKYYIEQEKKMKILYTLFDASPIRVKAEYTLETLDGKPASEIECNEKKHCNSLLDLLFRGDD